VRRAAPPPRQRASLAAARCCRRRQSVGGGGGHSSRVPFTQSTLPSPPAEALLRFEHGAPPLVSPCEQRPPRADQRAEQREVPVTDCTPPALVKGHGRRCELSPTLDARSYCALACAYRRALLESTHPRPSSPCNHSAPCRATQLPPPCAVDGDTMEREAPRRVPPRVRHPQREGARGTTFCDGHVNVMLGTSAAARSPTAQRPP
jgi:hypothetical protein